MEENKKLYSQNAIAVATFFGGPFAAGILIRKNCIALGNERQGFNALVIGIIATFLLFGGILMIPESAMEKVPNALIPTIYTAIIYVIVDKLQGKELKAHKTGNGLFYSNWRATGVGAVCCLILVAVILGGLWLGTKDWDSDRYNAKMERFELNESLAIRLYDMIEEKPVKEVVEFIEETGIPKWKENIDLVKETNEIPDIPSEYVKSNKLLIEYCQLRVRIYEMIAKSLNEDTDAYSEELDKLGIELEKVMEQLKE